MIKSFLEIVWLEGVGFLPKHLNRLFILNFGFASVHLLLLPLWFVPNDLFVSDLALVELLFQIVFPIILVALNFKHSVDNKRFDFSLNFILVVLATLLGSFLSYANGGISTKDFFTPDSETLYIIYSIITLDIVLIIISCIIAELLLSRIKTNTNL